MRFAQSSTSGTGSDLDVIEYQKGKTTRIRISINARRETITVRVRDIWGRPIRERTFALKTLFKGTL